MKVDILVVEDDEEDIDFIKEAFSEIHGTSVAYFLNTLDAITYLNSVIGPLPSLIITDYNMPRLDGFNLVSFLKRNERFRNIPLAVLSGSINEAEKQRLLSAGVLEIFKKPVEIEGYIKMAKKLSQIAKEKH